MKPLISLFALVAGTVATLCAQSSIPLTIDIPFAFYHGDTQMPVGEYEVLRFGLGAVLVRSTDGRESAVRLSDNATAKQLPKKKALVFRKYGEDRYFLGWIWHTGVQVGTEFPKSKKEREAVTSTLVSSTRPNTVMILARAR